MLFQSWTQPAGDTKKDRERYTKIKKAFCSGTRHSQPEIQRKTEGDIQR